MVLLIQPPRGFGENPVAIYHDPDLAPSHHYLGAYRWLEHGFKADAVVHLGKHGSLEWLPGKNAALSASCGTDAALGSLPLIYPFLVNDPGEGAQAKRRAHATIVDHLVPPMARAEAYGDIARLEQLLDEHANIAAMDPAKLPAVRGEIWTLMQAAELHRDLGLDERPDDEEFDDFILHIDGWLCEIKDAQIRDGLHILGEAPVGEARVNLVLAILRAAQVWGGVGNAVPGLRAALGLVDVDAATGAAVDVFEAQARGLVEQMEKAGWDPAAAADLHDEPDVQRVLAFAADRGRAAAGRHHRRADAPCCTPSTAASSPPARRGSPLRGLVNVLPTGRNFYTVDPRAVPSRLAWQTGQAMADSLLQRYLDETGAYPASVGLSVWGTSAMRTSGDDIAEVLALLGVRPEWDEESRRVRELTVVAARRARAARGSTSPCASPASSATPSRTWSRCSTTPCRWWPRSTSPTRTTTSAPTPAPTSPSTATSGGPPRGSSAPSRGRTAPASCRSSSRAPGATTTTWPRSTRPGAASPTAAASTAPRRPTTCAPTTAGSRWRRRTSTAVEHDIADSDDYFQYHGGMIATVRALTGADPKAYVGDSTTPDAVRTRTLAEETARVFRSRVVNPRWIAAMQRHGYKGAFELAATVDYLFGFDATAGVVHDWMYEKLAQRVRPRRDQPGLPAHVEPVGAARDRRAAPRGRRARAVGAPDPDVMAAMQQVYLEVEGDLEDRRGEVRPSRVRIVGVGMGPQHVTARGGRRRSGPATT